MTDELPPLPLIAEVDTSYFAYSDYPIKYIDGYEAGFRNGQEHMWDQMYSRDALWAERLATAVARERERCAQVIEHYPHWIGGNAKREIAAAIRKVG